MAQKVNIDKFIASLIKRERETLELNDDQLTEYESILFEQYLIYKNGEIVEFDSEKAPEPLEEVEPSSEPEYKTKFKEGDIVRNKVTGDTIKIEEVDIYNRVYYYSGWDGAATIHSDFGFHDEDLWELLFNKYEKLKEIIEEGRPKYFRYHRGSFSDSMATMTPVHSMYDVKKLVDGLLPDYFSNIHIGDKFTDQRCPQEWGEVSYFVLADFDGYTNQCVGYVNYNFEEETKTIEYKDKLDN